jgi:PAS domain-containing protein
MLLRKNHRPSFAPPRSINYCGPFAGSSSTLVASGWRGSATGSWTKRKRSDQSRRPDSRTVTWNGSTLPGPIQKGDEGPRVQPSDRVPHGRIETSRATLIDFVTALASMVSLALEESNRAHSEQLLRESEARSRESEERFSTAFRLVPLNITILRLRDAKFVEANDAFVRWLGLGRRRIIGRDSQELPT